jgi:HlyD family secretion protein
MSGQKIIHEPKDININMSDEIDQILGNPPSWILKWGITIVLLVVLIFGTLAWLIKYPDIISAKVVLVTQNPVIPVMTRTSGAIKRLFVTNDQVVEKGDVLALLDNPALYKDIRTLDSLLDGITRDLKSAYHASPLLPTNLQVGSLQAKYASLVQQLNANLIKQQQTLQKEVQLAQKDLTRNEQLHKDKVVSTVELERVEAAYLQIKRQLETTQNGIISNNITIEQLRTQVLDLAQSRSNTRSDQQLTILAAIDGLKSDIKTWEQTYLLKAPIDGQVSFSQLWSEEQFVAANSEAFSLVPSHQNNNILGRAQLPIANSGKVKVGQRVNIQLDGFPYQEHGVVKGTVAHISLVPVVSQTEAASTYVLEIVVPADLRTTYDKALPFRQGMMGTANVVTEDRSVLVRVFDRLNGVLKGK